MKRLCKECGSYVNLTQQKYLEELSKVRPYCADSQALFLPFKIKELEVTDIGPVRHFKAEFEKLNMITGGNGYGKSSIFNALRAALTRPRPSYLIAYEKGRYSKNSRIRLKFDAPLDGIEVKMKRGNAFSGVKCIVADSGIDLQEHGMLDSIAAICRKRKMQLILFNVRNPKLSGFKTIRLPGRKR